MTKYLTRIGVAIAVIVGVVFFAEFITSDGHEAVLQLAKDVGRCPGEQCTAEEEDGVYATLEESFNRPAFIIDWCMGINEAAGVRVHRGGLFKSIFIWVGRMPCGSMFDEETTS